MKKTIKITERDLVRIVNNVLNEALSNNDIKVNGYDDKNHSYTEKEMDWLYRNQQSLTPTEEKVLQAGFHDKQNKGTGRWPNIVTKNGEVYEFGQDGKLYPSYTYGKDGSLYSVNSNYRM